MGKKFVDESFSIEAFKRTLSGKSTAEIDPNKLRVNAWGVIGRVKAKRTISGTPRRASKKK